LIVITMVLSVFGARLVQLQGLNPKEYAAMAAANGANGLVHLTLPAQRGDIVDRFGKKLAESVSGLMIVADPQVTRAHAPAIARILADRLDIDYFTAMKQLALPGKRFAYIARRVPAAKATATVAAVKKAGYQGLDTRNDPLRTYPGNDLAANVLGFMNNQDKPAAGLEMSFNNELRGTDGEETYEVGGHGNRVPLGENSVVKPTNGKDVRLTIDSDVQWYAQRALCNQVAKTRSESGTAVVMDRTNGQILALADCPTLNSNQGGSAPKANWGSRAVSEVYEPGSVEKVLTMSSLIDQHKVKPSTKLVVPPQLPVADRVIHDYFTHGNIHLTLGGVIALSSNIGTVLAARHISSPVMGKYLQKFGLGTKTNLGLGGESAGILPDPSSWSELTHSNIAFGQGVAVTAVQMAAAVNTVANGGLYVSPSLVMGKATDQNGQEVGTDTTATRRVVTPETARKVTRMMELVTTPGKGTAGTTTSIPGYLVAGKTGTAQEPGGTCKCYAQGFYDVSFAGFAPIGNPRFTVYVVLRHPQGAASGSGSAGPVWRQIMSHLLQKYDVPPTNVAPTKLGVYW
jgi:cell division protein FtsI (penicillin-binding protein 3)